MGHSGHGTSESKGPRNHNAGFFEDTHGSRFIHKAAMGNDVGSSLELMLVSLPRIGYEGETHVPTLAVNVALSLKSTNPERTESNYAFAVQQAVLTPRDRPTNHRMQGPIG